MCLAAAVVVAAAAVVPVVAAAIAAAAVAAVAAAVAEQQDQDDDPPPAVVAHTPVIVATHNRYLHELLEHRSAHVPWYSGSEKMCGSRKEENLQEALDKLWGQD